LLASHCNHFGAPEVFILQRAMTAIRWMRPKALKKNTEGKRGRIGRLLRQISFRTPHILAPTDLVKREDQHA